MTLNVIVVNDYGSITGGVSRVAISSLNALADLGCNVTFVSGVGPIDRGIDLTRISCINFGLHDLLSNPSRIRAAQKGIWDFKAADLLRSVLRGYKKDNTIIHLHSWVKALSPSVIRQINNSGIKAVVTLHDYFISCPNGGFFNYQKLKKCELIPLSIDCLTEDCDARSYVDKVWRVGRLVSQKKIADLPDKVKNFITVSDYSEDILSRALGLKKKIFRVNNPIFVKKSTPATPSKNSAFIFIGRLSPEKGGKLFAEAAQQAKVRSVFAGSGSDENAIKFINPLCELIGWQSSDQIELALRGSRALIFPSLWHETQGLVISEAAAIGIPSVVSDGCAGRDSIKNGVTGLLFKHGDVDDLAKKIRLLSDDPKLADRLGMQAYESYWGKPQDELTHARDLLNCYHQIMEGVV